LFEKDQDYVMSRLVEVKKNKFVSQGSQKFRWRCPPRVIGIAVGLLSVAMKMHRPKFLSSSGGTEDTFINIYFYLKYCM